MTSVVGTAGSLLLRGDGSQPLQAAGGLLLQPDATQLLQADATQLLAPELVPWTAAALLGLGALATIAAAILQPAHRRAYLLLGAVPCVLLAIAQAGVAIEVPGSIGVDANAAAATARLAGYALALPLVLGLLARVGGLRRWQIATLGGGALLHVVALGGWLLLEGTVAVVALAIAGLLALGAAYGAVVALRTARDAPGRRLLIVRLAGLLGLVWTASVLAIGLSPRGAGVLDAYSAAVLGGYLDVVFAVGVGALLVRSGDALDELSGTRTAAAADDAGTAPPADGAGAAPPPDGAGTAPPPDEAVAAPPPDGDSQPRDGDDEQVDQREGQAERDGTHGATEAAAANDVEHSPTAGDGGAVGDADGQQRESR